MEYPLYSIVNSERSMQAIIIIYRIYTKLVLVLVLVLV